MKKLIYRGLAVLFTMMMLFSMMLPVAAMAELEIGETADRTDVTEESTGSRLSSGDDKSGNEEQTGDEVNPEQKKTTPEISDETAENSLMAPTQDAKLGDMPDEQQKKELSGSELTVGIDTEPSGQKLINEVEDPGNSGVSRDQQKQESSTVSIQSEAAKAVAAAGSVSGSGTLSAMDGDSKSSRVTTGRELFVDTANGSDETGNGTFEAPFASLQTALEAAAGLGAEAELCLLSDLTLTGTVHILGQNVTVTSNEGAFKIVRSEVFQAGEEGLENLMFEIGSSDPDLEQNPGGSLLLDHVVVDERGIKADPEQDAIIAVYEGGKLVLGDEAYLLNYGGNSAVHVHEGAELNVSSTAWILGMDDIPKDGTEAIKKDEGSSVTEELGSIILANGQTYDEVYGRTDEKTGTDGIGNSGNLLSITGNQKAGNDTVKETNSNEIGNINNDDGGSPNDENKKEAEEDDIKGTSGNTVSDNPNTATYSIDLDGKDDEPFVETNSVLRTQKLVLNAENPLAAAPNLTESSFSFSFTAPPSISSSNPVKTIHTYTTNDAAGYEILYTVSLNLGSFGESAATAAEALTAADIQFTITLDSLAQLYLETESAGSNAAAVRPNFSVLGIKSALYDNINRTVTVSLSTESVTDWKSHTEELKKELTLTLSTVVLPNTEAETYPYQKASVSSNAKVNSISFTFGEESRSLAPSQAEQTAVTKLLDQKTVTLVYDPNTGTGGPGTQKCAPETSHPLDQTPAPTHAAANGKPVIFCGWTIERDQKIYADGDTAPDTRTTVDLQPNDTEVHVYAVYSYDRNNDGIPDVQQKLLTLGYDANGGSGAPGPETKAAVAGLEATFDISQKEPARKYYTFLGWSKDENATEGEYKFNAERKTKRDITITQDTCLYAVWQENPVYTLYFNGNGGTNVPGSVSARSDNGVAEMTIPNQKPTRTGRTFVGWATERYGSAAFDPGERVKLTGGDVTLFAVWVRNGSSSGYAPKTGDEGNVPLYAVSAVGSAAAVFFLSRTLKKRRK